MNYNKVLIAGNLCRDPDLRYSEGGLAICEINVAVNHKYKTQSGEIKEEVAFAGCVGFGTLAENLAKFFRKGSNILIEGRLKTESWNDKTSGEKRQKTKVHIESWQFTTPKQDQGRSAPVEQPKPKRVEQPELRAADVVEKSDSVDDDVPF